MTENKKNLRRTALLSFPKHSFRDSILDEIAAGGFTDVGVGISAEPVVKDQGFPLEQGRELAAMCQHRGLGLVAFTGYQIYFPERIALDEPKRLLVKSDGQQLYTPYQEVADRLTFTEIGDATRRLIVQAGAFGEHNFTQASGGDTAISVNGKYVAVELPPATAIRISAGMQRFANQPSYAFPWHGRRRHPHLIPLSSANHPLAVDGKTSASLASTLASKPNGQEIKKARRT